MAQGIDLPAEDEFALCVSTALSPYLSWTFPRSRDHYNKYLTFEGVAENEILRWKAAFLRFLKKLTWKYSRPLILKSPPHTARIRLLLELFPQAKFVHIHRDPYTVYRSTLHTWTTGPPFQCLQRPDFPDAEDRIIAAYKVMYDAYFDQRGLIPAGHLCEIAFENLEHDPIGQVEAVYDALGLPDFDAVRSRMEDYLRSIEAYRKNQLPELTEPLRRRLAREWGRSFEEWGYPQERLLDPRTDRRVWSPGLSRQ
jgi:hypothetical protein